ncbi:pilus assembly protein [Ectothiorhodospira shaposhnikovii]|uniref:pilus assembly protein n=1 Tax=Ectothiorhodospira shaposhnikovii TaxID=1054 RepID=UPI001EE8DCE7|nr:PilC/PilY family type IV pilus protein [Ectothiorhodospira shaposhnikovii]MCG5513289.1 hypothetical protein [Ectothiorhodospira shaposhnikovii]
MTSSPLQRRPQARPLSAGLLGFGMALFTALPAAAQVNIANAPLFLTASVDPNVVFIIDDSGSMQWETMPDELTKTFGNDLNSQYVMWTFPRVQNLHGGSSQYSNQRTVRFSHSNNTAYFRSSHNNTVYYNPAITYKPWFNANGTTMPNADPKAAPNRPLFPEFGTRNLTVDNTQTTNWLNSSGGHTNTSQTFYPALYYHYNSGPVMSADSYTRVEIRSTTESYTGHGRQHRTDCANAAGATCTYAEEIQNFANWYSYHRSRIFAARGGIGAAFAIQPENLRVGYGAINKGYSNIDGISTRTVVSGVRPFSGSNREAFFNELYTRPVPAAGTPLRMALRGVGEYYERTDDRGPWSSTPGQSGGQDLSCRHSSAFLMSDGYWNGPDPGVGNQDGSGNTTLTGPGGVTGGYTVSAPFSDSHSNTLADVAMKFWKNDLRPDLPNRVPVSERNPAFWQHMVTYTVGLGVSGSIDKDAAFQAATPPYSALSTPWPNPHPSDADSAKIDDMLHAAINGRGGFFSASDPKTFADELAAVLEEFIGRVESSATSAAASSAVLQEDTLLYTTGFRSGDWSGSLTSKQIGEGGNLDGNCPACWDAEQKLRAKGHAARNIVTTNGTGQGISFQPGALTSAQINALNHTPNGTQDNLAAERIAWLRGDEAAHQSFRSRSESGPARLLGDIINSDPQFIGQHYNGFSRLLGAPAFRQRARVIYAGANDGMLHAFDADTGEELFAFIPGELLKPEPNTSFSPLARLMDPEYSHRFYVDGTAYVDEAQIGGQWKTILLGTMGAGGRSIFALDVTDPSSFGPAKVLWEFTDNDLGYNVGQPTIARVGSNGEWAAIFGNGYNSNSHQAMLFVVRLSDGQLIRKISTGTGSGGSPNGLGAPRWTDWPDRSLKATRAYAGDLQGNLWRFNLSHNNAGQWSATKLFTAQDPGGNPQPITSAPVLALDEDGDNIMVAFGTGSYFRVEDGGSPGNQVQTIYGLVDTNSLISGRNQLLKQEIVAQGSHTTGGRSYTLRRISDYDLQSNHRGWYIDLSWITGERVISGPTLPRGFNEQRVRFTTMIPDEDPCGTGRRGFLMELNLFSGSRPDRVIFDLNEDGEFDADDHWNNAPPTGLEFGTGERPISVSGYVFDGQGRRITVEDPRMHGRQSWQQLR